MGDKLDLSSGSWPLASFRRSSALGVVCLQLIHAGLHLEPTYLPEVVHLAVNQRLVLPLDVVDVLDVAGVEVLLHHEAQEAVVGRVGCRETARHVSVEASEVGTHFREQWGKT